MVNEPFIPSIIYYMGKKSSQTIQDATFISSTPFFQTDPTMSRQEIESIVAKFSTNQLIHANFRPTLSGNRIWRKILFRKH